MLLALALFFFGAPLSRSISSLFGGLAFRNGYTQPVLCVAGMAFHRAALKLGQAPGDMGSSPCEKC